MTSGIINGAMQTSPPSLDPHMTTTTATQQVAIHVFEPLITYGEDYSTIVPVLAESWQASKDGLQYTFKLRGGVTFHNGKSLSSGDAVASMNRLMRYSPVSGFYKAVRAIDPVDTLTFKITLDKPVDLLSTMANAVTWQAVMPAEQADAAKNNEVKIPNLFGTGPYKIAEWQPDVHVRLVRYDGYAATGGPRTGFGGKKVAEVAEIRFVPVKEAASRMAGLRTGDYDYAENLPISSRATLAADKEVSLRIVKPQWAPAWELNKKQPPMDNMYFRQALLSALDMDKIMAAIAFNDPNFFRVEGGWFFKEQTNWFTTAGTQLYNAKKPALTKELLSKSGYTGETIVVLSNRDYDWMYRCTLAAVPQLETAGIKVRIEFSDWPSQIGKALTLKGYHINQTGWSMNMDPVQFIGSLQTGAPYSYGTSDPEIDRLLQQVQMRGTPEERRKIVEELQRRIYVYVPHIRFGDLFGLEAVRANVEGYESWYVTPRFWGVKKAM